MERNSKITWIITLLAATGIFYTSSLTFLPSTFGQSSLNAIMYHMLAFFFLAFFLMIATTKGRHKEFFLPSALAAVIYGITDEVHQLFVPERHFSFGDILVDSVGITFAFLIYFISLEVRRI